ncbi:MAG: FkbM family methyltransferase [Brevundimonas sp.]
MRSILKGIGARAPDPDLSYLVGLNELTVIDRWALERRARAWARPVYLGDKVALTRILGRYKLFVSTQDVGFGAHVMLDGVWESWLTVFMARRVREGMRVVDAGANHGYYTVLFAELVGAAGRVAAFEPNTALARLLHRSVNVNGFAGRVEVHEVALGAAEANVELHASLEEPKNGVVGPLGSGGEVVRLRALADVLAHWDGLDFLKIDVEGAEEYVIAGAWPLLERFRPSMILEFNVGRTADGSGLLDRLAHLYGPPSAVDHEGELVPVTRESLLDPRRVEDWLLYYARPA